MYKFVIPDVRIVAVVFVTDEQPMTPAVPIAVATPKRAKDGKAIGNSTVPILSAPPGDQLWRSIYPPWVQDGNGADPDERSGSFTENHQNWKRRHDAERGNFQQN